MEIQCFKHRPFVFDDCLFSLPRSLCLCVYLPPLKPSQQFYVLHLAFEPWLQLPVTLPSLLGACVKFYFPCREHVSWLPFECWLLEERYACLNAAMPTVPAAKTRGTELRRQGIGRWKLTKPNNTVSIPLPGLMCILSEPEVIPVVSFLTYKIALGTHSNL